MSSCISVLVVHCEKARVAVWIRELFSLPSARTGYCSQVRDHLDRGALWQFVRRIGAAARGGNVAGRAALAEASPFVVEKPAASPSSLLPWSKRCELRSLVAFVRASAFETRKDDLNIIGERLRRLLGAASLPLQMRVEAWAAHAEVCLRVRSERAFRISLRYAVKHLAESDVAGLHVACALQRAPAELLPGNAAAIMKGLCAAEWPLRVAGLTAAAALTMRATAMADKGLGTVATTVCSAMLAFADEHPEPGGCTNATWQKERRSTAIKGAHEAESVTMSWPVSQAVKRRRLLGELIEELEMEPVMATKQDGNCAIGKNPDVDEELTLLAVVARSRLDAWLHNHRTSLP